MGNGSPLDAVALGAAAMLRDPCNAPLSQSCYRGDRGFKTRLAASYVPSATATHTSFIIYFIPGNNTFYFMTAPNDGTPAGLSTPQPGPGTQYIQNNASCGRSLGAQISITPNFSNLSTSGVVYSGIVPLRSLPTSGNFAISGVTPLLTKFGKISIDKPMEIRWVPAAEDEQYQGTSLGDIADNSDVNAMVMVLSGFPPSAAPFTVRLLNIVEWKPNREIGLATDSHMGNASKNTIEHVKQYLNQSGDWWTNVGSLDYSTLRGRGPGLRSSVAYQI